MEETERQRQEKDRELKEAKAELHRLTLQRDTQAALQRVSDTQAALQSTLDGQVELQKAISAQQEEILNMMRASKRRLEDDVGALSKKLDRSVRRRQER